VHAKTQTITTAAAATSLLFRAKLIDLFLDAIQSENMIHQYFFIVILTEIPPVV